MKLRIDSTEFARGTAAAVRAIAARVATPVLAGMVLDADDTGTLRLSAFDYETAISATVAADVAEPGRVVLPGKQLAAIAATLPAGDLDFSADGSLARLSAHGARYGLAILNADDYPTLPEPPATVCAVDADVFAAAVARCAVSARGNERGPWTTVLHVEIEPDGITLVATDSYTLTRQRIDVTTDVTEPLTGDVSARALLDAVKRARGTVELGLDGNLFSVTTGGQQTVTRLVAAEFPPYQRIIDSLPEPSTTVTVEAAGLIEALSRSLAVLERNHPISITYAEGGITYQAAGDGLANLAGDVAAEVRGETVTQMYNPQYLADAIKATPSSTVRLLIGPPRKAAVVLPAEGDYSLHVLAPRTK